MSKERNEELEILRQKIMDAIRFSEKYWMIFRQDTFGLATILDLVYKRSYIEVLFFTNRDVLEKGVPLLKIYTPIETELDLNEIIIDPDFDDDGLVSPSKIIARLNKSIKNELEFHLSNLNNEIDLINEKYENYEFDQIPYKRKIRIYFSDFFPKVKVEFENYPLKPKLYFSTFLSKIVSIKEFMAIPIMTDWDELDPPHIVDLIDTLVDIIIRRLKIKEYFKKSQHLYLEDVKISEEINDISFQVTRGQTIGIFYDGSENNSQEKEDIKKIFEVIAGLNQDFSGTIKIFGKFIQLVPTEELERFIILPEPIDPRISRMKVKKAIKFKKTINLPWQTTIDEMNEKLRSAGLMTTRDEILARGPYIIFKSIMEKLLEKQEFIEKTLETVGLSNKKDEKISNLSILDFLMFSIARALIQAPLILMFSVPKNSLKRLDIEKFNRYINEVKNMFHIPLIIHGPKDIIESCDKIITITKRKSQVGSMDELLEKIPQSGNLISIELSYPNRESIEKLFKMDQLQVIEERVNEKYKIFSQKDSNIVIKELINLFGPDLYHFKKYKASLGDIIEYMNLEV